MNIHPQQLAEIRRVVAEVRAVDPDDEQFLADSLEAETGLLEIVGALLEERTLCTAHAAAMAHVGDQYHDKARKWKERGERLRQLLGRIRDMVGANIKHPAGTVIVSERKPAVEYAPDFDAADLPDDLVRLKREPDKAAINAAVEAGRNVPGVRWGDPKKVVTIK